MSAFLLASRALHRDNDDEPDKPKATCPVEDTHGPQIVPFVSTLTFHEFATILSGACAIASWVIIGVVVARHALKYKNPVQQRQIIRILLLVPWVALFSFLIVWLGEAGEYLLESLDFGCAMALAAFLLLLCDYVIQSPGGFDELFGQGAWERGQFVGTSPIWLRKTWYGVLQFIPVSILIWIATVGTLAAGTYCSASNSPHFAHIWLSVLKIVCTTIAIISVFKFYGRQKPRLIPHKVFLKFFAFKGIVGLNVLQTFIINILNGQNILNPSKYLTYHDITSLPSLILACEMPLFALLLFFAFPLDEIKGETSAAGPITAIFEALNVTDLLSAFVRGPMRLVREQQRAIARQDSIKISGGDEMGAAQGYSGYVGASPSGYGVQEYGVETRYDGGARYGA